MHLIIVIDQLQIYLVAVLFLAPAEPLSLSVSWSGPKRHSEGFEGLQPAPQVVNRDFGNVRGVFYEQVGASKQSSCGSDE